MNLLRTYKIPIGFLSNLKNERKFIEVCGKVESERNQFFLKKIQPDIGTDLDERKLLPIIYSRLNEYSKETFKIEIPHADCTSRNFPSFYVFYFTYFFRYINQKYVSPELNDFIDLSNSLAAPYCERYYCEAKFTNLLNLRVKNYIPPSAYRLAKLMNKDGLIEYERFRRIKDNKNIYDKSFRLLPNTEIYSFTEMKNQIFDKLE